MLLFVSKTVLWWMRSWPPFVAYGPMAWKAQCLAVYHLSTLHLGQVSRLLWLAEACKVWSELHAAKSQTSMQGLPAHDSQEKLMRTRGSLECQALILCSSLKVGWVGRGNDLMSLWHHWLLLRLDTILRIFALGFFKGRCSYLQTSNYNKLDIIILSASWWVHKAILRC